MEILLALTVGLVAGFVIAVTVRQRRQPTALEHSPDANRYEHPDRVSDAVRTSLGSIDLGVLVFDRTGQEVYRNPAALFPSLTRPTRAIVDGEVRDLVSAMLSGRGNQAAERHVELYGPPRVDLLVRVLPSTDGDASGVVVIVDDVTQEFRLQAVRRSFVANVSHELRTPVGAIAVLAETLAATDDPVVIERLSGRLSNAAHRLGDMIEDLLELSRTEGGTNLETEIVAISEIVDQAVSNLSEPAMGAGVVVTTAVANDLFVDGDRHQLRSAIQNLLDNAIKYSEAGGAIRIVGERRGDCVSVSVADQGIGIPEGDLDRIFERFYRVDAARRRETGGTGLGLAIVRHVAINHGGDVSAFSVEGEGTTLTLELPALESDPERVPGEATHV